MANATHKLLLPGSPQMLGAMLVFRGLAGLEAAFTARLHRSFFLQDTLLLACGVFLNAVVGITPVLAQKWQVAALAMAAHLCSVLQLLCRDAELGLQWRCIWLTAWPMGAS